MKNTGNEWEFMKDYEGIEVGDEIVVEDDLGEIEYMIYTYSTEDVVILENEDGKEFEFYPHNLEEKDEPWRVIQGKA